MSEEIDWGIPDYDRVRVYFDDGQFTTMNVPEDENIRDAIVELCETEGWNMLTVVNYEILED